MGTAPAAVASKSSQMTYLPGVQSDGPPSTFVPPSVRASLPASAAAPPAPAAPAVPAVPLAPPDPDPPLDPVVPVPVVPAAPPLVDAAVIEAPVVVFPVGPPLVAVDAAPPDPAPLAAFVLPVSSEHPIANASQGTALASTNLRCDLTP
jgi:hypothetical protein